MAVELQREMVDLLPRMRRFAYTLTGSIEEADDVVQSACERALSRLHQFKPGSRLDSWMFRIVQNISIDRMRKKKRRNEVNDPEAFEAVEYDARIHEGTEARLELALVRAEISRLPEEQQMVLALVTVDGMSYQEAAETLDVPIGTVMSRLARARKKLAAALENGSGNAPKQNGRP
ncbi:MAG: RNA polymerase sigma factor [Alphaproteobacteria bacterium]|nr:RNA polymerase sigma factor [Alphaproteobacteria bacterium]